MLTPSGPHDSPKVKGLLYNCIVCVIAGALLLPTAIAQTVTGVVSGSVADSSGQLIPGAIVTLTSEATGEARKASTDATGDFVFTAVQPGRYTVGVESQGFKRLEKRNLTVTASERLAVGILSLEIGTVSDSVTVTAQGTPVQTSSQERSAVLTSTQMETLMSRARDFVGLLRVLPGVVYTDDPTTLTRSRGPTIQGVRNTFNSMSVDGLFGNDLGSTEWLGSPINMDAISEVKVLLNNYQAEYGRNAGAMVNAVTKSGTKDFHGTGYIYKRHEQFNANSFFNNLNKIPKPRYRFATGGYTLGGPIYIPGKFNSGKDKLFFFFSQEIHRTETPQPLRQVTVPTQLERAGNFSQTLELNGQPVVIRDPVTGAPFPDRIVPQSRIDLNGQKLLSVFPLPNAFDRAITRGNYNYNFQESLFSPKRQEVARIDYYASSKVRMYFRGTTWREDDQGYAVAAGAANWGMLSGHYKYTDDAGVYTLTNLLSPTLVNEFSMGAHHNYEWGPPRSQEDIDRLDRRKLGMTLPQFYPQNNPYNLIPWASFGGVPNAAGFSTDSRFPVRGADTVFTFSDGLSKVWRSHTWKAGFYAERARNYEGERGTFPGSFSFGRDVNNPSDTNWAYANALIGNFASYSESTTRPGTQARGTTAEWYLQDNWKVNRKLTLDYGMRFTWYTPYYQADKQAANFALERFNAAKRVTLFQPAINAQGQRVARNPATGEFAPVVMIGAIVPGSGDPINGMVTAADSSYPRGFLENQGVLFGPRAGFAYDVFGDSKTAIRGGFGIFYNTRPGGGIIGNLATNPPVQFTPSIFYGNLNSFINSGSVLFPSSVTASARSGETPAVYNFSLGVQRDIGFHTVLDVAYVGSLGRHLFQRRDLNLVPDGARFRPENQDPTTGRPLPDNFFRPYPGYGSINYQENASTSNYNSLQVQMNRRFSRGIEFGAAWTWSKAMDYTDSDGGTVARYTPIRVWNYGKAGYDRTHNLVANWLWDLPKASGAWNNVLVRTVLDNWQLSGIASLVSGPPMGIGFSTVDGADITGGGDGARVVVRSNPQLARSERTLDRFFDPTVFARPAQGTIGNAPKDVFRGPGINNVDLSIFKNFPIRERARLQFRWEMYNAFNHTQFTSVDTGARFDLAGNQVNTRFGALTGTRDPRSMQGSLRLIF
ncbi:MAG TPA: carboxypeptidase regulatory-like domain-containing protein [Bryobacteraceae bacterium]|nr:carboxypeptidase regulatory-like domain-containing protein [Bryobacteraceae bacterium]